VIEDGRGTPFQPGSVGVMARMLSATWRTIGATVIGPPPPWTTSTGRPSPAISTVSGAAVTRTPFFPFARRANPSPGGPGTLRPGVHGRREIGRHAALAQAPQGTEDLQDDWRRHETFPAAPYRA